MNPNDPKNDTQKEKGKDNMMANSNNNVQPLIFHFQWVDAK